MCKENIGGDAFEKLMFGARNNTERNNIKTDPTKKGFRGMK